jgi:hypothetical protein
MQKTFLNIIYGFSVIVMIRVAALKKKLPKGAKAEMLNIDIPASYYKK